ncbi:conserved hypothetical protein [Methanococcus vannielii SB]|uniref:Uncharacterized protein n=1 Tax=Methanococcus vannielii (strain ATCC 35089 / DSM 1224 / JCM 13029 / OCM 148 / SB) TaxID=406327 RepID=A6URM6_METVS|nr:hypothetical protein [Methanococcus vannielii]ABR55148.1 conserved hypothetical protein [Methanococcus vannielii SB]
MFQKKPIVFKFLITVLLSLMLFSSVNALNLGDLTVSSTNTIVVKSFNIHKVENYTYLLSYSPWGTLNESFTATVYLNDNEIETHMRGNQRSSISKDVSNILKNGNNELKIVSDIPNGYTVSLRLRNIQISEPPKSLLKLPINLPMNILPAILILFILKKFKG